jgi:hypothetical protein
MNSSGTRVVPTLTEVLDEQRLSRPASNLGTEPWLDSRLADEDLVPISLDWGDEPAAAEATAAGPGAEALITPWQIVEPAAAALPGDDASFIDLSIDVAPVRAPALDAQVLEVFARPPQAAELPAMPDTAQGASDEASADVPAVPLPEWTPGAAAPVERASVLPASEPGLPALAQLPEPAATEALAPPLPDMVDMAAAAAAIQPAPVHAPVPAAVLNMLAAADAASMAPAVPASLHLTPAAPLDPGRDAVRQGGEHVPGLSEERLQAIIQQALDRLLRDELPSALVETLIRLSPQLSESLIESLKPSLHLHVLEALSAEPLAPQEGRRPG